MADGDLNLMEGMDQMAMMNRAIYMSHLKAGFSNQEALEITKSFMSSIAQAYFGEILSASGQSANLGPFGQPPQ
jgi:hypothetical protein